MSRIKKSNHKTIKVTIIIYTFCVYRTLVFGYDFEICIINILINIFFIK